jgi:hypothetical protein
MFCCYLFLLGIVGTSGGTIGAWAEGLEALYQTIAGYFLCFL